MKRMVGSLVLGLGLLCTACGKLKPDSQKAREPKLGPAPAADSVPADSVRAGARSPAAPPDSASRLTGFPDTSDINRERRYASIADLAADRFIGCEPPVLCNGLAYFDCNVKGGGPGLYYDTATVALVSRCGSFCADPDEEQKRLCAASCPPKAWQGCPGG